MPHLVNLSEDPQLSEMLLYGIKEGTTTIGKCRPGSRHDIQLSGVLVADDHWYVRLGTAKGTCPLSRLHIAVTCDFLHTRTPLH